MYPVFDVIIIGAGPAGSMAAYELAAAGHNVLIIDKHSFPRDKICAGGLLYKTVELIPFDISQVIERTISNVQFSLNFSVPQIRYSKNVLMYCTNRLDFDNLLLKKAIEAGAIFSAETKALEIIYNQDYTEVITENQTFRAKYVIGADGVNGISRKYFNNQSYFESIGLEYEIVPENSKIEMFKDSIFLDYGSFPNAYSWIFPKKNHLSVGAGSYKKTAIHLRSYMNKVCSHFDFSPNQIKEKKAFPLHHRITPTAITNDSFLIVGDAAGLIEPFTGEGIYYAIRSGQIAAEVIKENFKINQKSLNKYQYKIDNELLPEIIDAYKLQQLFNLFTPLANKLITQNDRFWEAFCKILRGEKKYTSLKKKLGPFQILLNPTVRIAENILNR